MTTRACVRLLLAAILHLTAGGLWAGAQPPDRAAIRIRLEPETTDNLSGIAWTAMTEQLREIWRPEGVDVRWKGDDDAVADVTLPVIFSERELRKHDTKEGDAFGVTLFAGRSQRIVISISRARQVVWSHRGLADSRDAMVLDIAHGRLLGRVLAHEVGHAILLTLRHSPRGLMSSHLERRDVPPLGDSRFALTVAERERLATRFSNAAAAPLLADVSGEQPRPGRPATAGAAVTPITWTVVPPAPSRPRGRR